MRECARCLLNHLRVTKVSCGDTENRAGDLSGYVSDETSLNVPRGQKLVDTERGRTHTNTQTHNRSTEVQSGKKYKNLIVKLTIT